MAINPHNNAKSEDVLRLEDEVILLKRELEQQRDDCVKLTREYARTYTEDQLKEFLKAKKQQMDAQQKMIEDDLNLCRRKLAETEADLRSSRDDVNALQHQFRTRIDNSETSLTMSLHHLQVHESRERRILEDAMDSVRWCLQIGRSVCAGKSYHPTAFPQTPHTSPHRQRSSSFNTPSPHYSSTHHEENLRLRREIDALKAIELTRSTVGTSALAIERERNLIKELANANGEITRMESTLKHIKEELIQFQTTADAESQLRKSFEDDLLSVQRELEEVRSKNLRITEENETNTGKLSQLESLVMKYESELSTQHNLLKDAQASQTNESKLLE
eukprot:PhF_6_TR966/c0_g1_i2/m.1839